MSGVSMKNGIWRLLSVFVTLVMMVTSVTPVLAATNQSVAADSSDPRYFSQTGYRIDNDKFWDYFQHRGGINTFGYPVSRTFTFLGKTTQFFQRRVIEIEPDGSVGQLNILGSDLLPYTSFNFATIPAVNQALITSAPAVGSPNYGTAVLGFIQQHVPNSFNGVPVNYFSTFQNTVSLSTAFPNGGGNQGLLQGFDLEMWGLPLSAPSADPHNSNFVYQRFQRGIMMYDNSCKCTQGLLLGDYFKSILTGSNLPADLASEAANSPFFKQYNNANPNGLNNPNALPNTSRANAFVQEQPATGTTTPSTAPSPTTGFHYGFQVQFYGVNQQQVLNQVTGAGFNWVKQQVRWADIEPTPGAFNWGPLDSAASLAQAAGVKVLFSVVAAPSWASVSNGEYPKNPQDFANFMSIMASRYKGKVAAYEIWNEENFAREVGPGNINACNYVDLLKAAYPAIKAADPNAIVLSGAPTPTGVNDPNIAERDITYLQQMYQCEGGIVKNF